MTDIVEQLRAKGLPPPEILAEAADEIDRLRAFARWVIEDDGDIQEKAVSCGILIKTKYDGGPVVTGLTVHIYVYSPAFTTCCALEPKP